MTEYPPTPRHLAVTVCPLCSAVVAQGPGAAHHLERHVAWRQLAVDEVDELAGRMAAASWLLTR